MTVYTDKLGLYNKALKHLGERKLASLTENSEPRRYLDDEYGDALLFCGRQGYWNFGMRAIQIDASEDTVPGFGYQSAFEKPADVLKVNMISASPYFSTVLRDCQDQNGWWLANIDPIYVRYVSSTLVVDAVMMPADYAEYVGAYLALQISPRITQKGQDEVLALEKKVQRYLVRARANDAMDQPPGIRPHDTWVTSRSGRGGQKLYPSDGGSYS